MTIKFAFFCVFLSPFFIYESDAIRIQFKMGPKNIPAIEANSGDSMDPYAVLFIGGVEIHRFKSFLDKKQTHWNVYEIDYTPGRYMALEVMDYDQDPNDPDDFVGWAHVSLDRMINIGTFTIPIFNGPNPMGHIEVSTLKVTRGC